MEIKHNFDLSLPKQLINVARGRFFWERSAKSLSHKTFDARINLKRRKVEDNHTPDGDGGHRSLGSMDYVVSEGAVDSGGVTLEFMSLLLHSCLHQSHCFQEL